MTRRGPRRRRGSASCPSWQTEDYPALVARFEAYLTDYQNARYARRFRETLAKVEAAEERHWPGRRDLSRLAARALHKTMAIKDEYEVARLHRHPDWQAKLKRDFAGDAKVSYHLAPPMLAKIDPVSGRPRKRKFGPWMDNAFAVLTRMKGLRGTAAGPVRADGGAAIRARPDRGGGAAVRAGGRAAVSGHRADLPGGAAAAARGEGIRADQGAEPGEGAPPLGPTGLGFV